MGITIENCTLQTRYLLTSLAVQQTYLVRPRVAVLCRFCRRAHPTSLTHSELSCESHNPSGSRGFCSVFKLADDSTSSLPHATLPRLPELNFGASTEPRRLDNLLHHCSNGDEGRHLPRITRDMVELCIPTAQCREDI